MVTFQKENVSFKKGKAKSITHELGTKDITSVEVKDLTGKKHKGKLFIVSKDKITYELKKELKKSMTELSYFIIKITYPCHLKKRLIN